MWENDDYLFHHRVIGVAVGIVVITEASAQDRSQYPVKEQYDRYEKEYVETVLHPCDMNATDPIALAGEIEGTFGNGLAPVMESYIHMYETTGDLAYLYRFVDRAICMQEYRWDRLGIHDPGLLWVLALQGYDFTQPRWSLDTGGDGTITAALGHFAHYILLERPDLMGVQIPQFPSTHIADSDLGPWTTLGDFAEWLRAEVALTLDVYVGWPGYWISDVYCFSSTEGPDNDAELTTYLNLQGPIGAALYYIGEVNPSPWYLQHSAAIADAYTSIVDDEQDCVHWPWGWVGTPDAERYVLEYDNGAYQWTYFGWAPETCEARHGDIPNDYEDISHGVWDLILPRAVVEQEIGMAAVMFNTTDMVRFRNTFTQNIYAGLDGDGYPTFHPSVAGDDEIKYRHAYDGVGTLDRRSLAYMWLQEYDDLASPPNVYDIVMDYYAGRIMPYSNDMENTQEQYGLADVVAAQWQRECFDLTLFNRDVVYDQNFAAKHDLVLDPSAGPGSSFADPVITEERFTVNPDVHVEMRAGSSIELKPGFHATYGSEFHASIDPLGCGMEVRSAEQSNGSSAAPMVRSDLSAATAPERDRIKEQFVRVAVVADRNNNSIGVGLLGREPKTIDWELLNSMGQKVASSRSVVLSPGWNPLDFHAASIASGVYILSLTVEGMNVRSTIVLPN